METQLAQHLLQLSGTFGAATKLNDSTIGRYCAADGRFFTRIREGKTFTVKKYDEVLTWFSEHWPIGEAWPEDIPRYAAKIEAAE